MFAYYDMAELHWNISNHSDKEQGCGEGVKDWNVCDHNWRQHRKNWNCKNYSTQSLLWVVAHSPLDGAGEGFSQAKVAEVFSHWTKKDLVGTIHLMTCYCTILNLQVRGHWRSPENIYGNMFEECVTLFVHQYLCMTDTEECNVLKCGTCWSDISVTERWSVGAFSIGKVPTLSKVLVHLNSKCRKFPYTFKVLFS